MDKSDIIPFFKEAKQFCIEKGCGWELDMVFRRTWEQAQPDHFFAQYVFVVLNAGMKNQVAQKIYEKFMATMNMGDIIYIPEGGNIADARIKSLDVSVIGHEGKRKAIQQAMNQYQKWFKELQIKKNNEYRLEYLETLPWIGKITKYHLARNLGIDVAKPDRHLVRLCEKFGFKDVHEMCEFISKRTGDRIGLVDVVLWRALNLGFDDSRGEDATKKVV